MGTLIAAALQGDLPRVQALLLGVGEEEERVALWWAIRNGHLEVAEFLLAAGVSTEHDFCAETIEGYPLHAAAERDDPRAVALLLEAGAQPNVFSGDEISPLYFAQSVPVARLLLDAGANINAGRLPPLAEAARTGREALLRELLARPGVDIHVRDQYRRTPLHWAAYGGQPSTVAALLAAGADPCAVDYQGRTPIDFMSTHGPYGIVSTPNPRVITLLVAAGARKWKHAPTPCPGLEAEMVAMWKSETKERAVHELAQLFRRLEPGMQMALRAALRALHRGGLTEPLRMAVLEEILK